MINKLEDRGESAYIVEDGVARIITKDEYVAKLAEFEAQTVDEAPATMEAVEEAVDVSEDTPVSPEIAPGEEIIDEVTETPDETTEEVVDEINASAGEDTPAPEYEDRVETSL